MQIVSEVVLYRRGVHHQVSVPYIETAVQTFRDRRQLQALHSPDLDPRLLPCLVKLFVVQHHLRLSELSERVAGSDRALFVGK